MEDKIVNTGYLATLHNEEVFVTEVLNPKECMVQGQGVTGTPPARVWTNLLENVVIPFHIRTGIYI